MEGRSGHGRRLRRARARGLTRGQLRRIAEHHTDPVEAGALFAQARPRLAVLSHYPMPPDALPPLVGRSYDGRFEVGRDGMVIDVGDAIVVTPPRDAGGLPRD